MKQKLRHVWLFFLLATLPFSVWAASTPGSTKAVTLSESWEDKQVSPELTESQPVHLLLAGDIMLGRYIATLRQRNGGDFPFSHMPELLKTVEEKLGTDHLDVVAANLEGPIVEKQVAWGDLVFRFDPEVAPLLKKVGFTLFQMSNNHSYNQTRAGFTETQSHLHDAGLDYFGLPDTVSDPSSFISYDFNGTTVGFLGLNDTDFKLDEAATLAKIKELDAQVDALIIGIHWGIEYRTQNTAHQQELAHAFIDSGADFIWGTHPHVVENSEVYNGKTIYYSLGNFVFDQYFSQNVKHGLVLGLTVTPATSAEQNTTLTAVEIPIELVNGGEPRPQ